MKFSVNFLERRENDSPSIERVFRSVAENVAREGVFTRTSKARFGNSFVSTLANLALFRPRSADLYHVTGHITYMAIILPPKQTVLTIHDLTVLDFRTGIRRWLIKWLYYILPARRAGSVTAISDATKERLAKTAGIPEDRITVIENPLLVAESSGRPFNRDCPTVLQVGTKANKNLDRLIEALLGIHCHFRIIGPVSESQAARMNKLEIQWSNQTGLDDDEIETAYENADIVTFCSTHEGFGLPIIEAQAKSVAVLTSDQSPMKEVAGNGARLVDPQDVESIREGIKEVIEDGELRERLIAEGKQNIQRFAPASIAAQYVELYKEILEESSKR